MACCVPEHVADPALALMESAKIVVHPSLQDNIAGLSEQHLPLGLEQVT